MVKMHRVAFEAAGGDAETPTVDHRCHDHETCPGGVDCLHRLCCNPTHLAPESVAGNARRAQEGRYQDRCSAGHVMDDANTYLSPVGGRRCRTCAADRAREARTERGASRPPSDRRRRYRPRGMTREQLVEWMLDTGTRNAAGCLIADARTNGGGYSSLTIGQTSFSGHRLVHEAKIGPIPPGYDVDHTCHDPAACPGGLDCPHRGCIEPTHLRAVTHAENMAPARACRARPAECKHGHPFTTENTYTDRHGSRHCRACASRRATDGARKKIDGRARVGETCRNGHVIAEVGLTYNGRSCRECARVRNQEYALRRKTLSDSPAFAPAAP